MHNYPAYAYSTTETINYINPAGKVVDLRVIVTRREGCPAGLVYDLLESLEKALAVLVLRTATPSGWAGAPNTEGVERQHSDALCTMWVKGDVYLNAAGDRISINQWNERTDPHEFVSAVRYDFEQRQARGRGMDNIAPIDSPLLQWTPEQLSQPDGILRWPVAQFLLGAKFTDDEAGGEFIPLNPNKLPPGWAEFQSRNNKSDTAGSQSENDLADKQPANDKPARPVNPRNPGSPFPYKGKRELPSAPARKETSVLTGTPMGDVASKPNPAFVGTALERPGDVAAKKAEDK